MTQQTKPLTPDQIRKLREQTEVKQDKIVKK